MTLDMLCCTINNNNNNNNNNNFGTVKKGMVENIKKVSEVSEDFTLAVAGLHLYS